MNACLSVWGVTVLAIPARRATFRTIRPAPVDGEEDGPVAPFAGGQVDRPGGARRERDGDDLAALAGDRQGPVPSLQAQLLDIGTGGLRDPQTVQGEEGYQRMLERRTEPRG